MHLFIKTTNTKFHNNKIFTILVSLTALHISMFESFLDGDVRSKRLQPWSNLNLYMADKMWHNEPSGVKS